MNTTIGLLLLQDGLTTGFIYALLALSILLVFLVTRVLWVPAGDFLVFGALTLALLQQGQVPGTVWLCGALGLTTAIVETWRVVALRRMARLAAGGRHIARHAADRRRRCPADAAVEARLAGADLASRSR